MFDNVVIGADGGRRGRDTLALAKRLASSAARATLVYVQVVRKPDPDAAPVSLAAERGPVLDRIASLRDDARLEARVRWLEATSVAEGLHRLAEAEGADVLVIGASRRDELERKVVADDVSAVLEHAPCAVAVAP